LRKLRQFLYKTLVGPTKYA